MEKNKDIGMQIQSLKDTNTINKKYLKSGNLRRAKEMHNAIMTSDEKRFTETIKGRMPAANAKCKEILRIYDDPRVQE